MIQILRQLRPDNARNIPVVRIKFRNTILTKNSPNNTVLLNNNKILEINSMYIPKNENIQSIKITGIILKKIAPLYVYPYSAEIMEMWRVSKRQNDMVTYMLSDVQLKMIQFNISSQTKENIYVMPLLHT